MARVKDFYSDEIEQAAREREVRGDDGPRYRTCWFCDDAATGSHSHFGDYVPVCGYHSAELDRGMAA